MSCAARQARYAAKGWRMAAIERYLDHGGALCAGLEYVTLTLTPTLTLTLIPRRVHTLALYEKAEQKPADVADPQAFYRLNDITYS